MLEGGHGLPVTSETFLCTQVCTQAAGLPRDLDNLKIAQGIPQVIQAGRVNLFALLEATNLWLGISPSLFWKDLHGGERPTTFLVVVSQFQSLVSLHPHFHPASDFDGSQRVVVNFNLPHIPRGEFEQIFFNPVTKLCGEFGRVNLHPVDRILTSPANKPQQPAPTSRPWLLVFLANDQPGKLASRGIPDFHKTANSSHPWLDLFLIGLNDPIRLVIECTRADHIECLQIDQLGRCCCQMILRVSRVVLV